eukprot:3973313-Prymnesium_polylepis.1
MSRSCRRVSTGVIIPSQPTGTSKLTASVGNLAVGLCKTCGFEKKIRNDIQKWANASRSESSIFADDDVGTKDVRAATWTCVWVCLSRQLLMMSHGDYYSSLLQML